MTPGDEKKAAKVMHKLLRALKHVHGLNIIHRDIKPQNIMWSTSGDPKLIDFGVAVKQYRNKAQMESTGTPFTIAPEVLAGSKGGGHSFEVDVWSIGVIVYTLLVGTPPFQTADVHATYKRIRANAYEFPEGVVDEGAKDLIRRCLSPKPGDRPKIGEIATHPLMNAGWHGATTWTMPAPIVDLEKMARATRPAASSSSSAKPREPRSKPPTTRSRAPLSPLTVADPRAADVKTKTNMAPANVVKTPPPATPAPFDVLDSDVVGSRSLARTPAADEENASSRPPRRAAETGARALRCAGTSLHSGARWS